MEDLSYLNVVGCSTCKEKLSKEVQSQEDVECIISKLPEAIIIHILSFLPAKDAVRTSVLSKTWTNSWTYITKLDLDDSVFFYSSTRKTREKQYFMDFVYRTLLLTKSPTIESFSLVITSKYSASVFNSWISGILNRNVKSLRVCSHFDINFTAYTSNSLIDSETLEELVLKMIFPIKVSKTPLHFRHLKCLKLSLVVFDINSRCSEDLTFSLPVLKVFEAINCTWLGAESIDLRMPLVESVLIEHNPIAVFHELESLTIMISASRLTKFTFCSYCHIAQHVLLDPSSAHNASADITIRSDDKESLPETRFSASQLLGQFSEVKNLKFDGSEVMPLSESNVAMLPVFGMLSHLELGLVTVEFLLALLLRSPVLGTLDFEGVFQFNKELLNSATVPHCLTSTLQLVKFGKVYGLEHELFLAKFMMENGLVMERMSFSLANHHLAKSRIIEEFKQKLFSFKKGFSSAIIEFTCN